MCSLAIIWNHLFYWNLCYTGKSTKTTHSIRNFHRQCHRSQAQYVKIPLFINLYYKCDKYGYFIFLFQGYFCGRYHNCLQHRVFQASIIMLVTTMALWWDVLARYLKCSIYIQYQIGAKQKMWSVMNRE